MATASDISFKSVRYDKKMPKALKERLIEWVIVINFVESYFHDLNKTILWFQVPNPQLGGISPRDMIRLGRYEKLRKFIQTALKENEKEK